MAVVAGVISTTSYRKKLKRATPRSSEPAPQRAASGSKGGQASRRAALQRSRASRQRMDVACADSISQPKRWSDHGIYSRSDAEHMEDDTLLSQLRPTPSRRGTSIPLALLRQTSHQTCTARASSQARQCLTTDSRPRSILCSARQTTEPQTL